MMTKFFSRKLTMMGSVFAIILILLLLTWYNESNYTYMTLYTGNIDTLEIENATQVRVESTASVEDRLLAITKGLSDQIFKLPMELLEIREIFNQKIAIVNVMETRDSPDLYPWNTGYFQGSTGGAITSITLVESYLQNGYEGEWIDGVKFLYEGETIEFEHVFGLQQTQYRSIKYVLDQLDENDELLPGIILKSKFKSEDLREVAYELEGEFPANVLMDYNSENSTVHAMIFESPLRALEIEIPFTDKLIPYKESFDWMIHIQNPEVFQSELKAYDQKLYQELLDTGSIELSLTFSSFSSWLIAESEYSSSMEFVEFIERAE
ncbi:MAG: hypothetical protein K8R73_00110 [Clostridiales bacterium]|nr:hypothetical protein [Clostridiales bacterium]